MPARTRPVLMPNLGLHYDKTPLVLPDRALKDGINFRVREGKLTNRQIGWTQFGDFTLNGPVRLISSFKRRDGVERLIFGTPSDLYRYDVATGDVFYITPRYATGTVEVSGTAVTGSGTGWTAAEITAGMEISFGSASEDDPAATWYVITGSPGDTSLTLTTDAGTIGAGSTYTIRKVFTGDIQSHWDWDTFMLAGGVEDRWYGTNGIEYPVRWDGDATQVTSLSALGFRAKHLVNFSNMMIWGNIDDGSELLPADIINSDVGDPEDVSTGLSEQFTIHAGPDEIVDMKAIGDNLVIYARDHLVMVQFVGDPLIFAFRQAASGVGMIGTNVVANFGSFHEYIGLDSQYTFDGASLVESGVQVWREILRRRDPARPTLAFHHFDDETAELIWAIPTTEDDNDDAAQFAWTEHYLEQVDRQRGEPIPYSHRDFPFSASGYFTQEDSTTWATVTGTWADATLRWNDQYYFSAAPLNLVGGPDGKIYLLNSGQSADGTALPSFVTFGRKPTVDGRQRGMVNRVYPFVHSIAGDDPLVVTTYYYDHASGDPVITDEKEFDLSQPEDLNFVTPYRRGRYFEVQFGVDDSDTVYELDGYDVETRYGGSR